MEFIAILENFETVMSRNLGILLNRKLHPNVLELSNSLNQLAKRNPEEVNKDFLELLHSNRQMRFQLRNYSNRISIDDKYNLTSYLDDRIKRLTHNKEDIEKAINDISQKVEQEVKYLLINFDFRELRSVYSVNTPAYIFTTRSIFCDYLYIKKYGIMELESSNYKKKKELLHQSRLEERIGFSNIIRDLTEDDLLNTLCAHYKYEVEYLKKVLDYLSLARLIVSKSFSQNTGVMFDLVGQNEFPQVFYSTYHKDVFDQVYGKAINYTEEGNQLSILSYLFYIFQELGYIKEGRPQHYRDFLRVEYDEHIRQLHPKNKAMKCFLRHKIKDWIEELK